jgi:hypothetical protein
MNRIVSAAALASLSVLLADSANSKPVEFLFSGSEKYFQGQLPAPYDTIGPTTPLFARLVFDDAAADQCPPGLGAGSFHVCPADQTSELGFYTGIGLSVSFNNVTVGGVPELVEVWNDYDHIRRSVSADMFAASTTLPDGTRIGFMFLNDGFGLMPPFTSDSLPTHIDPADWMIRSFIIDKGSAGLIFGDIRSVIYRAVPEPSADMLMAAGFLFSLCGAVGIRATAYRRSRAG